MVSISKKRDQFRLVRSRLTGVILIGVMGFLVIGVVFQPVASSLPQVAPQQAQIPIPENTPTPIGLPEENPNAVVCTEGSTDEVCTQPDPDPVEDMEEITSEDTPLEQIIDETKDTISDVVLPDTGSTTISLISEISKTDSTGFTTIVSESFNVQALSFFVEDESDRDFENGRLVIKLKAKSSEPTDFIEGTSTLDILIGNQTIFPEQIPMTVSAVSGTNGTNMKFISQTGIESDSFTFSFADHLNSFPFQGVTEIEVKVNDLSLTLNSSEEFGATSLNVFSMNIATDPDLIVVTNEQGETQRIYPSDIGFAYHNTGLFSLDSSGSGQCRGYNTRDSGTIEIFDSENVLLESGRLKVGNTYTSECGRFFNAISLTLDRNTEYRLVHSGDTDTTANFDITFETPKSQKNFSLRCYYGNSAPLAWHNCNYPSPDGSEVIHAPPPTS